MTCYNLFSQLGMQNIEKLQQVHFLIYCHDLHYFNNMNNSKYGYYFQKYFLYCVASFTLWNIPEKGLIFIIFCTFPGDWNIISALKKLNYVSFITVDLFKSIWMKFNFKWFIFSIEIKLNMTTIFNPVKLFLQTIFWL